MANSDRMEAKKSEETDAQRKAAADARKKETERLAQEKLREEARKRAEDAIARGGDRTDLAAAEARLSRAQPCLATLHPALPVG